MGRPSQFTPKLRASILAQMAGGLSLSEVCRQDGMPDRATVHRLIQDDEDFRNKYARAAEARADTIFDEMFDIADDGTNDWMERENGPQLNAEHVQRSRLRIETRKWALSKMNPKKYGEKIAIGGADDLPPIQTEDVTPLERINSRLTGLAARAATAGNSDESKA